MARNPAAFARAQRERDRRQKRQEKKAQRQKRREEKAASPQTFTDPADDPSIDWGEAVREVEIKPDKEDSEEESEET